MKGGVAACLEAARAVAGGGQVLRGDLLVVLVADEEEASRGMQEVLRHETADAAIVTEPTELELCVAHKGFAWMEVETRGRAAHGSRFDLGVDANLRMGRVLSRLSELEQRLRASAPHPLLGPPSLHAATLHGGSGLSTYADRCRLQVERRTLPGETQAQVLAELETLLASLNEAEPDFLSIRPLLFREGWEVSPRAPIVGVVADAAAAVRGRPPQQTGAAYWMDAALLAAAGIETVVIGPAGGGAHATEEWVELQSVERLAAILTRAALRLCGG